MATEKKLYVIKYSNGMYSCGYRMFSSQLRQAQIYVSKKRAEEQALHYTQLKAEYTGKIIAPTSEYSIVEVELREVGT